MKIEVKKTFVHARQRYEAGEMRTVEDALGAHFIKQGWAVELGGEPVAEAAPPAEVTLDIHGASHASEERNHG